MARWRGEETWRRGLLGVERDDHFPRLQQSFSQLGGGRERISWVMAWRLVLGWAHELNGEWAVGPVSQLLKIKKLFSISCRAGGKTKTLRRRRLPGVERGKTRRHRIPAIRFGSDSPEVPTAEAMASTFSFPLFEPAEIAEWLRNYGIAPSDNLRVQDVVNPQPGFVAEVLARFLATYVCDEPDEQLQFHALQVLDNPEHHIRALRLSRIYKRANAFLRSIQFHDLNLRDLLRADGPRVAYIVSALINFLLFREERLTLLQPIVQEYAAHDERHAELSAKIAKLWKVKEDHLRKEQEEAPMVQQLEKEVNDLRQTLVEYNNEQLSLRKAGKALDEKKEETLRKINQADFQLVKVMQEKEKLEAKIVHSPEKLQRNLEEKKAVRDELKNLEKMAMQKVQEKTNTLEMYTEASEKLEKHLSKISAVLEKSAAAKASEKDVKAQKEKISDQYLEIKALRNKAAEWQLKVLENEAKLKAKENERDRRVGENDRKMTALKSELESELKCLEEKQRKITEKIEKGYELCSQADSVTESARKKTDEIYRKYNQVCEAAKVYLDGLDQSFDEIDVVKN